MIDQVRFEVGEKYENMKGVFEVIAIHRDSMDIRWDSGEEISTPIALQQRIIERMAHEKELEEEQSDRDKKTKATPSRSAKPFAGFENSDFGTSLAKTVWRGRGQLGGAVSRQLKKGAYKFSSWAVLRQPEVHWLDIKRQKQEDLPLQIKFFARLDETGLDFGIYLPAPAPAASTRGDWQSIMTWLETAENAAWLTDVSKVHELVIRDRSRDGFAGVLESQAEGWVHRTDAETVTPVEALRPFLMDHSNGAIPELSIEKRLPKAAAIEREQHIAEDMAALFDVLMPLYGAAAQADA